MVLGVYYRHGIQKSFLWYTQFPSKHSILKEIGYKHCPDCRSIKNSPPDYQGAYLVDLFASGFESNKSDVDCSTMDFREFRRPHVEDILGRGRVYGS